MVARRRSVSRLPVWLVVVMVVVLTGAEPVAALTGHTRVTGRVVIGATRYELTGTIIEHPEQHRFTLHLAVSSGPKEITHIELDLTSERGMLMVGERQQQLPSATATRWHGEMASSLLTLAEREHFVRHSEDGGLLALDSPGEFMILPDTVGKIRLRYRAGSQAESARRDGEALCPRCELLGLEFFSLEEWRNGFGAYVAFTMNFEETGL